jgi:hypothetical protein
MTKYQMTDLTPWTEERKSVMSENIKKTKLRKYGNKNYNNPSKSFETRVKNGNCTPKELKTDFELYKEQVLRFTRKNNKDLKNQEKKGRAGVEGAYHLDHKFSILQGFYNFIPPFIIGSKENLEYIPWKENQKKNKNCSIEEEKLILEFYK